MTVTGLDILAVVVAIAVVTYAWFQWSFQYWKKRNVPHEEPSFPFGNTTPPYRMKKSFGDEVLENCKKAKAKGWKYFGSYMFQRPTLFLLDPELIKNVMTKDFSHFTDRSGYVNEKDDPLSANLFSLGGLKWRNLRVKVTPTFTSGKMRTMFQTLANCGKILEDYVGERTETSNKKPIDIKNVFGQNHFGRALNRFCSFTKTPSMAQAHKLTIFDWNACFSTDIIGSCAFGLDCNTFKEPNSPFRTYSNKIFVFNTWRIIKQFFVETFPNLGRKLHIKTTPDDVTQFFSDVVEKTVKYREEKKIERNDFLQLLIQIKNNEIPTNDYTGDGTSLTMNEITAQSFAFFVAGFETSSTTMTFTLYELAVNPEIQEKVREELRRVLKKHDNKITYDALKELEYLEKVVNEILRKYPPLPFINRLCVEDYKVPDTDLIIEKNIEVNIPIVALHYDEEYYKNPEKFDPERFSEENKQQRHPYTHIPFGEGRRICMGMRFGMMQSKMGLASILKNHKVILNEKTKVPLQMSTASFIPTAEGGIWLNFEKV